MLRARSDTSPSITSGPRSTQSSTHKMACLTAEGCGSWRKWAPAHRPSRSPHTQGPSFQHQCNSRSGSTHSTTGQTEGRIDTSISPALVPACSCSVRQVTRQLFLVPGDFSYLKISHVHRHLVARPMYLVRQPECAYRARACLPGHTDTNIRQKLARTGQLIIFQPIRIHSMEEVGSRPLSRRGSQSDL